MTDVQDRTGAPGPGTGAGPSFPHWRGDVALELWVDVEQVPARIRLAGTLDGTTAANLSAVVVELLAEGVRDVELATEGLRVVDSSAVGALADVERLVRGTGGRLTRVGPSSGPFTRQRLSGPFGR